MRKLLRADFYRLFRDKIFLIACAVMFIIGAGLPVAHYIDRVNNGTAWSPDQTAFTYALLVPILLSAVVPLFIGVEYSGGAMRNRIIAGHGRCGIYLSKLIVCAAAGEIMCAAYILPNVWLGLMLLGAFEADFVTVFTVLMLTAALTAALAAIFAAVSMLCRNRAYSAAGCVLLSFALLFAGVHIVSALNEPEYYSAYSYSENGVSISEDEALNPNYLRGAKRRFYEFLQDFTPGSQALSLANMKAEKPCTLAVYDGIIAAAVTGCGIFFFRRKDLR